MYVNDPELRQIVESTARTAQAILEAMAEAGLEREEARDGFYVENKVDRLLGA